MDIRQLIYVSTIAEYGNLTKAANALHITQPSLSQSIHNIENIIGTPLFIRSKKGMTLTESGQQFLQDAQVVIDAYNDFQAKLNTYSDLGQTYRIGFYRLIHTTPINDLVMTYIAEHNEDTYTMTIESIETLEKLLKTNELDMAFIKYTPIYKRSKDLIYTPLYRERLCILMNTHHPLTQKKTLRPKDLKGMKILTSHVSEYPYKMIEHIMKTEDIPLDILVSTNYINMSIIADFITKNLGITFATEDVCRYYENEHITWLPLDADYFYDLCMVEKKGKHGQTNSSLLNYISDKL